MHVHSDPFSFSFSILMFKKMKETKACLMRSHSIDSVAISCVYCYSLRKKRRREAKHQVIYNLIKKTFLLYLSPEILIFPFCQERKMDQAVVINVGPCSAFQPHQGSCCCALGSFFYSFLLECSPHLTYSP